MNNISTIILAASLFIIMLGMGLSLVVADFKRIITFPKAVVIGLFNQLILLPLIAFGLVSVFPTQPEIAIGIMILAACPGGATSNLIAHLAKGDTALSVTLTAVSSFITLLTIPFIVNFALNHFSVSGQEVQLDVIKTIIQILVIVVIPIVIGMVIRKASESFAIKMEKPVKIASAVVLGLVIVGLIVKEKSNIISYFQQAGIIAFLLNVATMAAGYFSAKLFKINKQMATTIAIESGIQNGTLGITIAVVMLGNSAYGIAPAIYSLLMFLTGGVVIFLSNKK